MPKAPKSSTEKISNSQQIAGVPQQAPQSINPFNSIDPFIQSYTQPVQPQVQQMTQQQMVPEEQYLWYLYDQFNNLMIDQFGPVVIDIRNGIRVNPLDQYGNPIPFMIPQTLQPRPISMYQPQIQPQIQPQQVPQGATTTSRIIRDTGKDNGEMFLLDDDFFLEDSERIKFPKGDEIMNYYNTNFVQQFTPTPQMNPIVGNPVNIMSTIRNITGLPIKIRYSEKDFNDFYMTSEALVKHLLDKAFENHPELRYSIVQNPYGFYEMSIFKNGIITGKLFLDFENYGGKGLPIMHGIVGKQYSDNHVIVPLGATKAVEECIMAIAYNTGGGVNAITEAKYKHEMLPEHIYATIDFGVTAFPDGLENYKEFGKIIEHIDKYYQLNTRYRLYGYKDNYHFTLVSDEFVKPFSGNKAPILHEAITVENNTLTIKQPNGNTKVVQMGA